MAKSPEDMAASMLANLKDRTGKTLPQWLKIVKASKLEKHGEIVKLLKGEHGVTHGYASMIAHQALGAGQPAGGEDLVEAQYAGAKAALRPIYEKLIQAAQKFGADVEVSPKKTYVSLRRRKQFALVQPSTKTRIDVGLNLKGEPTTERLEPAGSLGSMVTHRVRVTDAKQVDRQLVALLKQAYERA